MASTRPHTPARRTRRRHAILSIGALAAVVAGLVALGGTGGVAPGVTVAGIELGGSTEDARAALTERGRELARQVVTVRVDGRVVDALARSDLGATADVDQALAVAQERAPGRLSRAIRAVTWRGPVRLGLPLSYDDGRLDAWITDLAAQIDRAPRNARLDVSGREVAVSPSVDGLEVRQAALRGLLTEDAARLGKVLDVPLRHVQPALTTAEAERAAVTGRGILSRPTEVVVRGIRGEIPPSVIARALTASDGGAALKPEVLAPALSEIFARIETPGRSARFETDGKRARVIPSRPGLQVDAAAVARGLAGEARPVRADLVAKKPALTTAQARALGIREKIGGYVGKFTYGEPRVVNVTLGAKALDGTIIPPGETLSLNEVIGERTRAAGYVAAPMIAGSLEVNAVGGGVSQVATTLFNAALESGLAIEDRTAHSLYIGRYEIGRDATISWPEPDLVIRNDWPVAVLIRAAASDTFITVNMYSQKLGREVFIETSPPFDYTPIPTRKFEVDDLKPDEEEREIQEGSVGFSVTVTRRITQNGAPLREGEITTIYRPHPTIIGVRPGTPDAEKFPEPPPSA